MPPRGPSLPSTPRTPTSSNTSSANNNNNTPWPPTPTPQRKDAFLLRPSNTPSTPTTVTAHKTFLRIHLHRSVMSNMDLRTGDLVSIRPLTPGSLEEPSPSLAYPAVAWPTADASMNGRTVLVAEGWRKIVPGLEWDGRVLVGQYSGEVGVEAGEVLMEEVTEDGEEVKEVGTGWRYEGEGWHAILENALFETKYVFEDMPLLSLEFKGIRRTFAVRKVVPIPVTPKGKVSGGKNSTSINGTRTGGMTAYKVLPSTTVTLKPPANLTTTVLPIAPTRKKLSKKTSETGLVEITSTKQETSNKSSTSASSPPPPPPAPPVNPPTFAKIGGLKPQLEKLTNLLLSTLQNSHHFSSLDLTPFRGILLHGPPGTGKSLILRAIPHSLPPTEKPISTYQISGSIVGKYLGESEASIRKIFSEAKQNQPSIIFVDEIDSIAPARVAQGGGETSDERVVATLVTQLDELGDGGTVVVAATSRPNAVHHALRRPGRLEREIEIPRPDVAAREEILNLLLRNVRKSWLEEEDKKEEMKEEMKPQGEVKKDEKEGQNEAPQEGEDGGVAVEKVEKLENLENHNKLSPSPAKPDLVIRDWASRTHGFVGADLEALVRAGVMSAISRLPVLTTTTTPTNPTTTSPQTPLLLPTDIEHALKEIRPTAMRDIVMETPKVLWSDIGGQHEVKQRLREAVEWPLLHPHVFARLGGTPRKGLLLYGPPGCSKTLTAKALATESGLNFMPVRGPELLNMYVGESERAVREVFRKARAASPSIVFFDEVDAIAGTRGGAGGGEKAAGTNGVNVLAALLNEMDGIDGLKGVIVLAATNRPEAIDPALMRPGRLETILYVGPPDYAARMEILRIKTRKMAVAEDVDLESIAEMTEGFSGAELVNICDEAIHYAMREDFAIEAVAVRHFALALEKAVRQITKEMREFYEGWSVGGVKKI